MGEFLFIESILSVSMEEISFSYALFMLSIYFFWRFAIFLVHI